LTEEAAELRAADFVRRFAEFWSSPSADRLAMLLADDVRLVAPMTPVTDTLADGERAFSAIFDLIPDLTAEVHGWGATDSGVLIDFTLSGSAGGAPISWRAVDRIAIGEDGLATERVSHFDSLPLILAIARRPRVWPAFLRSRLGGRR
jgi:SnoaL-like protein